ncbi:MAG TPA: AraC family transcriptional regulator [Sandaracinaceae bacterium LLY-WYZ-13_1]|nr:AraC family transcriptional regulator [Sandaracinaceae bacterium LLY-WYZ-13_1]
MLEAAGELGLAREDLLADVGLDAQSLADERPPVPLAKEDALWRAVLARTGEETFGLRAAELLRRGAFRGLEYAMRSSQTLGEGLTAFVRFSRLLHGAARYGLRHEPDGGASVTFASPHTDRSADLSADFALASIVMIGRDATQADWTPRAVRLRRRPPLSDVAYRALFGTGPSWQQAEDALELGPRALATRMREADAVLFAVLEHYLAVELEALDPMRSLEDAVRAAIVRALPKQDATLEAVARDVGLSPRVLQKRLQAAGTSFQELLDGVREGLAKRYLTQPGLDLSGAALLLGYSDVTAFHRAFKRWTGLTPGEFRRRASEPPRA